MHLLSIPVEPAGPRRVARALTTLVGSAGALLLTACLGNNYWFATGPDPGGSTTTGDAASSTGELSTSAAELSTGSASSTTDAAATGTSYAVTSTGAEETTMGEDAECGDGLVQGAEECDDGNDVESDGCLSSCVKATCGDGQVFTGVEECDDDSDECLNCARDRVIFVTSEAFHGFDMGSLVGAHLKCQELAQAAGGVVADKQYAAWLSAGELASSPSGPSFFKSAGRYVRPDGQVVAEGFAGLTSGALQRPIVISELGEVEEGAVWTGTKVNGEPHPSGEHCDGWLESEAVGVTGTSDEYGNGWTEGVSVPCGASARLYCVEQ